ncbi:divalent-cation tolerance protein CutA [bacterium]|nr:divalent-cation tolerance protein CutA [bacterium]
MGFGKWIEKEQRDFTIWVEIILPFQEKKSVQASDENSLIVVLVTVSSEDEARLIGNRLLKERLAACVQIVSGIRSLFVWKEKMCDEEEILLLIKSRQDLLTKVITLVKKLHSYEVPEVVALPIVGGSEDYLGWLNESLL